MELSLNRSTVVEAGAGHLSTQAPLQSMAGIVKDYGIVCTSAVEINRPRMMDIWLMLLTGSGAHSIALSKPILIAEKASVQASLSAENDALRYRLKAHGQGFRKAGLELVRKIHTGTSMTHGLERVTATKARGGPSRGNSAVRVAARNKPCKPVAHGYGLLSL